MNYGKFFRLNNAKSDLSRGIAVFDYIWLENKQVKEDLLKFPIYLTILPDSIDFYVHYYNDYLDEDILIHKNQHNTILSLPLSANLDIKDGLTGALVEGWKTIFPIYDTTKKNNYLYDLLKKVIEDEKDNDYRKENVTYSILEIFDFKKENIEEMVIEKETDNKFPLKRFIRKLILDFLFDLEHTKVFQSSRYYEHISVKLRENFFFNALANKAKYYYYRKITEEYTTKSAKDKLFFLKKFYLPAEEQWIKSITSPKADEAFTIRCGNSDEKEKAKSEKAEWFDLPNKEMENIRKDNNDTINCYENIIKEDATMKDDKMKSKIQKLAKKISQWQLGKFDFCNAKISEIIVIAGLFSILSFIIIFIFGSEVVKNILPPISNKQLKITFISTLVVCFVAMCAFIIKNFRYFRFSRGIHFLLLRLLGSIAAAWITLSFNANIIRTFREYTCLQSEAIFALIFMVFIVFMLIYNEIRKTVPYIKCGMILLRSFLLLLVAFFYSFCFGLLTTATIGLSHLNYKVCVFNIPVYLIVFTLVAMFIGIFINLIFADKKIIAIE